MTKRFLIVATNVFLLFTTFIVHAQEIIFTSGFENQLETEWELFNSNMPAYDRTTESKKSGLYGFHMEFDMSSQKGNLTPKTTINWEAGKTYVISFYYKAIVVGDNSSSNIKMFAADGSKIGQVNFKLTNSNWTQYTTNFTPSSDAPNGELLLSMRPNNSGNGAYYFDDFLIEIKSEDFFEDLKTKDVVSNQAIKWYQFGPGMSGNNNSLYPHPTEANVVFTSPNMGNAYRSVDKGKTFETIFDEDARYYNSGYRGAVEMFSIDFSRQNADLGFCTGKRRGELYKSTDMGHKWELLTNTPSAIQNAILACVAVSPHDDNIWFLGGGRMRDYGRLKYPQSAPKGTHVDSKSQGKIWKSTDKGASWVLTNTGLDSRLEVETILVDPVDANTVYAGTNYGFYKSVDGGQTWTLKSNGIDHDMIRSFDMHHDKNTDQITLFVLSNVIWKANGNTVEDEAGGIYKSEDKGETWTNISGDIAIDLNYFKNNQGVKKDYYISIEHYFGLSSLEEAENMYPVMPTRITQRFNMLTVDPLDVNNLYLINNYSNASVNNFKPGQIWRSSNGGSHWYVTLRNGKNWNNGSDDSYWVSQRNNPMGTNVSFQYKSDWLNRDDYERKGCNFIKFSADGKTLYTQMAKIGFVSYDKGLTWIDEDDVATGSHESWVGAGNSNVPGHGFYQTTLIPNKVFCPSGENSLWITNDEGKNVRANAQAAQVIELTNAEHSVSSIVVHPNNPKIWFATFFRQDKRGQVLKSVDSGKTWFSIGTPVPLPWPEPADGGDQAVHQLSLIIDESNPNYMYFCVPRSTKKLEWVGDSVTGWGVHRSSDGGVTWEMINNGLPNSLDVSRLKFDPNDPSTLYATVIDTGGGLYKSTNKGDSWFEVESTKSISGNSGINDIHFDVEGKIYITSGFKNEERDNGGLWVSEDSMATWTKIFDYPWTNRVEVARYNTDIILLSTLGNSSVDFRNAGTFLSKDGGTSWEKINKGNGQSDRVNDIAIDFNIPGKFYSSTRGSGWYTATDSSIDDILSIRTEGVSCLGSANGSVTISARTDATYTVSIQGGNTNETADFTNVYQYDALEKGSYTVVVSKSNKQEFNQEYSIVIEAPGALEVNTNIITESKEVSLDMVGGKIYKIDLNGDVFVTENNHITLNLKEGDNALTVATNKECQGVFEDAIKINQKKYVYPNPARDVIQIKNNSEGAELNIYSVNGKLLVKKYVKNDEQIHVNQLNSGLYFYTLVNDKTVVKGEFCIE